MKTISKGFIPTLFLSLLFLTNCGGVSIPDSNYNNLLGTWNWVQTNNTKLGTITKSTDYSRSITFKKDGEFAQISNNIQAYSYKFTFGAKITMNNITGYQIIFTELPGSKEARWTENAFLQSKDTLLMNNTVDDAYFQVYVKQK